MQQMVTLYIEKVYETLSYQENEPTQYRTYIVIYRKNQHQREQL